MAKGTPPTSQRAAERPISFVLDDGIQLSSPVTLVLRPEDLTRTEPARVSVHQTLGREVVGWADHFGEGLPAVTIAGHTGWRALMEGGPDGSESFQELNAMIVHEFPEAKQRAIESGLDPAIVKLLFIDTLDDFAWSVIPTQFVLRRSRSRPLLYQYSISLQALSTQVDTADVVYPTTGNTTIGLGGLGTATSAIASFIAKVRGIIASAVQYVSAELAPLQSSLREFLKVSTEIFQAVKTVVSDIKTGFTSGMNIIIGIGRDVAQAGWNVLNTVGAVVGLPASIKAEVTTIASAYNEIKCILSNSLKPGPVYQNYGPIYGASNCSSTTGGSPASPLAGQNVFDLMYSGAPVAGLSSASASGVAALSSMDPVLAPMSISDINRNLMLITWESTV